MPGDDKEKQATLPKQQPKRSEGEKNQEKELAFIASVIGKGTEINDSRLDGIKKRIEKDLIKGENLDGLKDKYIKEIGEAYILDGGNRKFENQTRKFHLGEGARLQGSIKLNALLTDEIRNSPNYTANKDYIDSLIGNAESDPDALRAVLTQVNDPEFAPKNTAVDKPAIESSVAEDKVSFGSPERNPERVVAPQKGDDVKEGPAVGPSSSSKTNNTGKQSQANEQALEDEVEKSIQQILAEKKRLIEENILDLHKNDKSFEDKAKKPGWLEEYLRGEDGQKDLKKVLSNKEFQKEQYNFDARVYKRILDDRSNNFKTLDWQSSNSGTKTKNVTNAKGEEIATLTETTHKIKPVSIKLEDGKEVNVDSYRTVDFPQELKKDSGPMHVALALKDSKGNNIAADKALYFTAHYDKEGKLKEVTAPQPIKFSGEGKDAVGYIEKDGEIYTMPVNRGQYEKMMKEVENNKGVSASIMLRPEGKANAVAEKGDPVQEQSDAPKLSNNSVPPKPQEKEPLKGTSELKSEQKENPSQSQAPVNATAKEEKGAPPKPLPRDPEKLDEDSMAKLLAEGKGPVVSNELASQANTQIPTEALSSVPANVQPKDTPDTEVYERPLPSPPVENNEHPVNGEGALPQQGGSAPIDLERLDQNVQNFDLSNVPPPYNMENVQQPNTSPKVAQEQNANIIQGDIDIPPPPPEETISKASPPPADFYENIPPPPLSPGGDDIPEAPPPPPHESTFVPEGKNSAASKAHSNDVKQGFLKEIEGGVKLNPVGERKLGERGSDNNPKDIGNGLKQAVSKFKIANAEEQTFEEFLAEGPKTEDIKDRLRGVIKSGNVDEVREAVKAIEDAKSWDDGVKIEFNQEDYKDAAREAVNGAASFGADAKEKVGNAVKALAKNDNNFEAVLTKSDVEKIISPEKEKPTQERGQASGTDEKSFAEKIKGKNADAVRTEFTKVLVNGDENAVEEAVKAIDKAEAEGVDLGGHEKPMWYVKAMKDATLNATTESEKANVISNSQLLGDEGLKVVSDEKIKMGLKVESTNKEKDKNKGINGFGGRG